MPVQTLTTPNGETLVVLPLSEYETLRAAALSQQDAHDNVMLYDRAKAALSVGEAETLTLEEVEASLLEATPLAFWRKKRNIRQKDLSCQAGISASYLSDLEAGRRKGDPALFFRLAQALRVPLQNLIAH